VTFADTILLAFQSLKLAPLRSCLTTLGLAIGVGAILTVLTLGSSGQDQVETEISHLGVDKIWVTSSYGSTPLSSKDAVLIQQATGAAASGRAVHLAPVRAGGQAAYAQIAGVDAQASAVYPVELVSGRFLSALDQQHARTTVVIDQGLCDALCLLPSSACGTKLAIGGCYYTIAGVISNQAVQTPAPCDGCAYIPLPCFESAFGPGVDEITINLLPHIPAQELVQSVLAALPASGQYQTVTLENEIAAARSIIRIFVMVLACVACICMGVGGIGVMNILLVSVRERRREIGLLKALGATRSQVCNLFLCEAVLYAIAGSLGGLAAGLLLIHGTGQWIGLDANLSLSALLPTLGGAGIVVILFGLFPALKAAGLMPVKALNDP